jgi:hypothetical protein
LWPYRIPALPDHEQSDAAFYLFPVLSFFSGFFGIFKHPFYLNKFRKIAFLLCIVPDLILGQETTSPPVVQKENARFVIKLDVGVPKTITSTLFRKSFNGFYDASISFNFRTVGNFYFGVGYENVFFKANAALKMKAVSNSTVTFPYDTRILGDCPFVTLAYDRYIKEGAYVTYGLSYGYMLARYTSVFDDSSAANLPFIDRGFNAQFIKPSISWNFIDRDNPWVSFKVMIAYTTLLYQYDPKAPRLAHLELANADNKPYPNRYFVSWLTVGFGLNFLIGKSKE